MRYNQSHQKLFMLFQLMFTIITPALISGNGTEGKDALHYND